MSDERTVPQILADAVIGIPEDQEVFIPAKSLREAKIDVDKSIPDGRPVRMTVATLKGKLNAKAPTPK